MKPVHFLIISSFILFSCANAQRDNNSNYSAGQNLIKDDTLAILKASFDSAWKTRNAQNKNIEETENFSDSVIVVADSILFKFFPLKVNNVYLKFLTSNEACKLVNNSPTQLTSHRCLVITDFHKDIFGNYYVFIENNRIVRVTNKEANIEIASCDYSLLGGWELLLNFKKKDLLLLPTIKYFSSY